MKRYAHVKNEDDTLIKFQDYHDDWDVTEVAHKFGSKFDVRIIPYEVEANLEFDAETHVQEAVQVVMADKVKMSKNLRALTNEELAVMADIEDRKAKKAKIKDNLEIVKGWISSDDNTKFKELCQMFVDLCQGLELDK